MSPAAFAHRPHHAPSSGQQGESEGRRIHERDGSFETEILTSPREPEILDGRAGKCMDRAGQRRSFGKLLPDLNNSVGETYGRRERSAATRR